MREIKFRIYNKSKNIIEEVRQINYATNSIVTKKCNCYVMNECELMQYTGLHDKNGKEIYEGDIVRKLCWNDKLFKDIGKGEYYSYAKVSYIEELGAFYIVNNEGKICWELGEDKYNIEVCGNIYENKSLLDN